MKQNPLASPSDSVFLFFLLTPHLYHTGQREKNYIKYTCKTNKLENKNSRTNNYNSSSSSNKTTYSVSMQLPYAWKYDMSFWNQTAAKWTRVKSLKCILTGLSLSWTSDILTPVIVLPIDLSCVCYGCQWQCASVYVCVCVCVDLAQVQSRHQESYEENQQPGSPQQVQPFACLLTRQQGEGHI